MTQNSVRIRRIAVSALLLSLALVLKTFFSIYIPLFGENGMNVGLSGIFSMMPALLFGPWYGAAVSGLSDFLGYVIKPAGAYMPLLTLMAAVGGFLRGLMFQWLRKAKPARLVLVVLICSVLLIGMGIADQVCLAADGVSPALFENAEGPVDVQHMNWISRMLVTRVSNAKNPANSISGYIGPVTTGPILCGALGLIMLLANLLADKYLFKNRVKVDLLAIMLAVVVPGLIVTTVNTVILRETYFESWKVLPFVALWIPRAAEEIIAGAVKSLFMSVLMGVFVGQSSLRKLVKA